VAESFGTVLCSLRQNCLQEILEREENRDKPEKEGRSCSVVTPLALPSD